MHAVSPMHKDMHNRTRGEQNERKPAEEMRAMLGEEIECRDDSEPPEYPLRLFANYVFHAIELCGLNARVVHPYHI